MNLVLRLSSTAAILTLAATMEGPVPAPPAAVEFHLGGLELTALRDGDFVSPNDGADFGSDVGPGLVGDLLVAAGAPRGAITLSVDALLLRMPGHLVLLDTGLGPRIPGALPASLRLAGVTADQVSDLLITHAHPDHVGGLLGPGGNLAFPNATIWLSRREWAWMQSRAETKRLVAVISPRVKTFEPGRAILPGVTPIRLYGHTPGHVGYEITSRGAKIEDIGDIAHSSIVSLARPWWVGGIDEDPAAAAVTRQTELKRLAAAHELVFAPHFPFPGVGWVVSRGNGYAWAPYAALR